MSLIYLRYSTRCVLCVFCGERRSRSRPSDYQWRERTGGDSSSPATISKVKQFRTISFSLPASFRRYTEIRLSRLSGVYARGSKGSHIEGECVIRYR